MEAILKRNSVPWQEIDKSILILQHDHSKVYELNETASWLWKSLESEKDLRELVDSFIQEYKVSEEVVLQDFTEILKRFKERGLISEQ